MYGNRFQARKEAHIVTRPAVGRNVSLEQHEQAAVLELLANGPARIEDIAQHLHRDQSSTHQVIRRLRDEDKVHGDSGYWVLGPQRVRRL